MLKVMLVIVLAASIGLCGGHEARAAFTGAERAEIVQLVNAQSYTHEGLRYMTFAISAGTTTQTRTPLADAILRTVAASREASLAYGLLLNIVVEQHDTPGFAALQALSRPDRVAIAWWRMDRSIAAIEAAQQMLTAAHKASASAAFRDAVRRARDIWLFQAKRELVAINRGLTYAKPLPLSYPKIIGPHGSYDETQWFLWRANWYALDMLEELAIAYRTGPLLTNYWPVYKAINSTSVILDIEIHAQAILAGITFTAAQAALNPFFRVVDQLQWVTEETSERYHEVQAEIAAWIWATRSTVPVPLTNALVRLSDSWRNLDQGVWQQLIFPNCEPPTPCAGRS